MAVHRDVHRVGWAEYNPIAQWLLDQSGGELWLLLAAKTCGTIVACWVLLLLYWKHRPLAWAVAAGVTCIQAALLVFVLYS